MHKQVVLQEVCQEVCQTCQEVSQVDSQEELEDSQAKEDKVQTQQLMMLIDKINKKILYCVII